MMNNTKTFEVICIGNGRMEPSEAKWTNEPAIFEMDGFSYHRDSLVYEEQKTSDAPWAKDQTIIWMKKGDEFLPLEFY